PAIFPRDWKSTEVESALEAVGDETFVLFRSDVKLDAPFPGLSRSNRRSCPDADTNDPILGVGRRLSVHGQFEPRRLWYQRGEVPGAVDSEPIPLQLLGADCSQVIDATDVTAGGPHDFGWPLADELLFGCFFVAADKPRQHNRDGLRLSAHVLDADVGVDGIAVSREAQGFLPSRFAVIA